MSLFISPFRVFQSGNSPVVFPFNVSLSRMSPFLSLLSPHVSVCGLSGIYCSCVPLGKYSFVYPFNVTSIATLKCLGFPFFLQFSVPVYPSFPSFPSLTYPHIIPPSPRVTSRPPPSLDFLGSVPAFPLSFAVGYYTPPSALVLSLPPSPLSF